MHTQRGFTLVEVLVVTLIGFGLLAGLTSLYLSGQGTYLQSSIQLQSQRDASFISDEFALRARFAHAATVSGGNTVQFTDSNGNNTYSFSSGGSPAHFLENGSTLVFSQVDSLGFSLSGQTVTMGLIVSDPKYKQRLRISTSAVMRN